MRGRGAFIQPVRMGCLLPAMHWGYVSEQDRCGPLPARSSQAAREESSKDGVLVQEKDNFQSNLVTNAVG